MKTIEIPDRHLEGFKQLLEFNDSEFEKLKTQISTFKFDPSKEIFDGIGELLNQTEEKTKEVLSSLISIFVLHAGNDVIDEDFLGKFKDSFIDKLAGSLTNDAEILISRVKELYTSNKILLLGLKAASLIQEAEHLFSAGRIFSDIRPIFNNDKVELSDDYAVIMHRLKIEYEEEDGRKDIYFTMTNSQILQLADILTRAIEKEVLIKEKSGFKFL